MRVLLTGASGFIGGVLARRLAEHGEQVTSLVRRPGSAPPGTDEVLGDLGPGGSLADVLAEARPDCVVHLAAEIASQRSEAKVREVNVEGTIRLLDACRGLPGESPRIVFSSTVVTGDARGELLSEDRPLPVETPYGRSKQEGERLVLESGLPAVVIRPSHVYGSGGWYAEELVPRLRQPGRLAVIGSGANLWDVVHVEDVVSALVLAIDAAHPGSVFHVADDEPISFYDFMALTAKELGVGAPRRVPAAVARLIAGRNAVDAVVRSARSSNALIKQELGWTPRFPTAREGVPDALAGLVAA
ncbi:MAG TPA: NAD(P)-dependent oxidoreductase [Solirubrobacteraceae bacterium]|jgi:nucleoside-diphosphate-sugar epimerase|nr:NAD(P)-dependent oxidoreductase [Solirubrobacteraceae bacterium]